MHQTACEANPRLLNHVAIVTASTRGIGYAIARRLLQEGATVVISSRKQESVDAALKTLREEGFSRAEGRVCHVSNNEQRKALIDDTVSKHGNINILVNNAAISPAYGPIIETSEKTWDKIFETNVKAGFLMSCEVAKTMIEYRKRTNEAKLNQSIIFISSIAAYRSLPLLGAYSVSKTALLGLSKALATEWGPEGIRVNCICPGVIKTQFSELLWKDSDSGISKEFLKEIPQGRFGDPDEVAGVVAMLVSSDGSYVTGESITISGGLASKL